jgi:hypothetical protein
MKLVRPLQALAVVVAFASAPAVALAHPAQGKSANTAQNDTTKKDQKDKKGKKKRTGKTGKKAKKGKGSTGAATGATNK